MKERKVFTFNSQGEKLVGIETLPDGKGKFPAVILAHGIGVNKDEYGMFIELAAKLATIGIASYRFDFSGCGESEGHIEETTLTKLEGDLDKILEFVKSQSKIGVNRICIMAQSFATPCTVALKPKVKCLILTGSISNPAKALVGYFGPDYNPNGISIKKKTTGFVLKVNPNFWTDFKKYNPLEDVKQIHCPILFIHGAADEKIPVSEMYAYFKNANEPKEKVVIEGANHGFEPHREEMYTVAIEWLKKNL